MGQSTPDQGQDGIRAIPEPALTRAPEAFELAQQMSHPATLDIEDLPVKRSRVQIAAIMSGLLLSIFLAALDQTIISTSIATIAADFKSASGYTWVASAYLLSFAASGPIWVSLSNIWGRKPMLLTAVAWFAGSSIVCATAKSMTILIMGRAFQGVGGGGLALLVNVCISDLFSTRERGFYFGLTEVIWTLAGGLGPILGGTLAEKASWRWNWWINLPCCGLAFVLHYIYLDVHNPRTPFIAGIKAVDWCGSMTIMALTIMVLLGLDFGGETFPWDSPKVICLIVFGLLFSIFFFFSEVKLAKYPLLPLNILRHRSNVATFLVDFCHGFSFMAVEYYLPLFYQSAKGASPIHSGLMALPAGVFTSVAGTLTGIFIHQTGRYRELVWSGSVMFTLGLGLLIKFSPSTPLAQIIVIQIITAIGSGMLFQSPMIALHAFVSQDDTANATAAFEFIRNIATSFSVVIGGVVFQNGMQMQSSRLKSAGLPRNITDALSGKAAAANVVLINTIEDPLQKAIVKDTFAWSMRNMWIMYCVVGGCGMIASMFIGEKKLNKEHVETRTGLKKEKETLPS